MREREVYPNAPIVLAAVEVRHTMCEPMERRDIARITELIRDALPLPGEIKSMTIAFQAGPEGQATQQQPMPSTPRWTSRDRRTALTFRQDAVVVETTDYGSFERLRALLGKALRARADVAPPAGVERVGLRYIDEVRAPSDNGSSQPAWGNWVDASLLGPTHLGADLGLTPSGSQGVAVFAAADDRALVVRYGPQDEYAVASTPQLRRPLPPPGPLFLLDIDSFWQPGDEIPDMTTDNVLDVVDRLHEPVSAMFESLITERLREEVLRRA